jgi:hypothetical protein
MGGAAFAVLMLLAGQDSAPPAPPPPDIPVSVQNIREALQRPALRIPPPVDFTPVFRATIVDKVSRQPAPGHAPRAGRVLGLQRTRRFEIIGP